MQRLLSGMIVVALLGLLLGSAQASEQQVVRRIYFVLDRAEILPASRLVLHEVANLLRANPDLTLQLVGHTCDLGSNEYNRALARLRAENALTYLMTAEGIPRARVMASSFGEEQPQYANTSAGNRALNRRVVLTLDELTAAVASSRVSSTPEQSFNPAVLLMDISNTTNPGDLRNSVRQFLDQASPLYRYQDYGLSRESGTRLYDAITKVSDGHMASHIRPRYLVIFSDGADALPRFDTDRARAKTLDQAVSAANVNGVRLITIELGPATAAGRRALQELASRTGGQAFVWNHAGGPDQFAAIHRLIGRDGLSGNSASAYRPGDNPPVAVAHSVAHNSSTE